MDVFITSILLALFADTKILNIIVLSAYPSLSGVFMTAMYVVVVVGLFYMGIMRQQRSFAGLSLCHISICALCVLWYVFTFAFISPPSVSAPFFAVFTVSAFLIPGVVKIDTKTFLLALLIFPSIGVPYVNRIILYDILEEGILSMGLCYALLVPVLANLAFLRFYFMKEEFRIKMVLLPFTIINVFYLVQMATFGSRGPMFCVILLLATCFLVEVKDSGEIHFLKGRTFFFILFAIFVSFLFLPILHIMNEFLASWNISLNVIDKFLIKDEQGDMSNGRAFLIDIAVRAIADSPFLGYGVSQFERNTGNVYPHNFVIQLMYDGGFVLTSSVLIPAIVALYRKIRTVRAEEFVCLLFLFFFSVPGSLFSGDLWQAYRLWLLFGFLFAKNSIFDKESK